MGMLHGQKGKIAVTHNDRLGSVLLDYMHTCAMSPSVVLYSWGALLNWQDSPGNNHYRGSCHTLAEYFAHFGINTC